MLPPLSADRGPSGAAQYERGFRSLFELHPDGIFLLDRSARLLMANPAAERISGYTVSELARVPVASFVEPQSLPLVLDWYERAVGGEPQAGEITVRHKDGRPIDLAVTLVPMEIDGVVEGVYGIAQDITERRRIEQERAALLERAIAAERRAALLSEASAVLNASLEYEQTLRNLVALVVPAFADWCTVDVLEENGAQRRIVAAVRPELRREVTALAEAGSLPLDLTEYQQRRLRAGESIFLPLIRDELLSKLGVNARQIELIQGLNLTGFMRVPMLARGTLVGALTFGLAGSGRRFDQGDLESAQGLGRRAALAIDNARLYQEAQAAVQARDAFLASASHDLRTPVTTIKAMAQVLQRRVPDDDTAPVLRDGLQTIDETAGRITRLIDELLDVSRLQSGRPLDLERRPCDLLALVRHAAKMNRQISANHQIRIETAERALIGLWDPLRLERVIDNLLSNALKYSPAERDVVVTLAREAGPAGTDSDLAVLRVQDYGIGIPAADLPHIFERFYRARNVSGRPGSGIGLAGAHEIVLQHGGSINVESREGEGTTFTVRLPFNPPDED